MDGTSNTHYRDLYGNPQPLPAGYKVHPAFQAMEAATATTSGDAELGNPLGKWNEELEGIWVAKYEASREDLVNGNWVAYEDQSTCGGGNKATSTTIRMVSKPSRLSWRAITEKNIYANSLNMYENLGSHEMKNSEWGAVAYLAQSAYGRNGNEIGINQNYLGLYTDGTEIPRYTGAGPGGTADVQGTMYEYDATFESTYAWNTTQGKKASTTGNIYGVYDLNGGAWEYMAGYVNNGHSYLASQGGTLTDATNMHTKQVYKASATDGASDTRAANYALNSGVYGDAVYETSTSSASSSGSWNGDYSYFPCAGSPFFERGGGGYSGSNAGAFTFHSTHGGADYYSGFRTVLSFVSGT